MVMVEAKPAAVVVVAEAKAEAKNATTVAVVSTRA
jgi:hypothetical protein